jgi:hypothetical protein
MRLKSRTEFPPGEFQLLLPEIGMKASLHGSFREMVIAFLSVVQRNPALAQQLGWPTTQAGAEAFVDERECRRLLAAGFPTFVDLEVPAAPSRWNPSEVKKKWRGAAAAVINGGKAAFAAYASMFGPGGKPVDRALAETRAQVCLACPKNDVAGGLPAYFLESTANGMLSLLGALKDLDVSTSVDDKLGVCKACKCPTRAKVFVPLEVIVANMPAPIWPELQREGTPCWILRESGRV